MGEFSDTVATMRQGAADRAASAALERLVEAVRATEKGGAVTLKITVAPLKDGDVELEVKAKVTLTLPSEDIKSSIYYASNTNRLVRSDPRQGRLQIDGEVADLTTRRMGGMAVENTE
jgi:hypothetical protein